MPRKSSVVLFVLLLAIPVFCQESRHFTFRYAFTVKDLSLRKKVRIWMPAARSDAFQQVRIVSAKGDLPLKQTRESKFGNEMYYAETKRAPARTALRGCVRRHTP